MTAYEKNESLLKAFGIPAGEGGDTKDDNLQKISIKAPNNG